VKTKVKLYLRVSFFKILRLLPRGVIEAGRVFTDEEQAKQRQASTRSSPRSLPACRELRELTATSTAAETFEAVANALYDTQKALLLVYRHRLDEGAADAAHGS
jgi:hypothetical protein